ncbi:formate hydrogenlyase subunit 6/NADH:ubiquinone oxidoreductase 23 kD subunit [Longilinea arvoryzae]|uniref:Formate hydrogenlyase subunit 6/NADH:ubiquinone oxidoreductase 23 kD subunit n=1 Tax=Longilinea arvoryzae TaxID=360412 RepID=A0A0S7BJC4_9CHLR|nr:4Fe-4S binding protein [Longilinea arvoryzae]GAP14566.1 formate hydrogenlyase subunit 6/NADH:ubiquinone oxidoreductase 23 kD subunit [Longilinea arvoryzae]
MKNFSNRFGVIRGLGITLGHFINTYIVDIREGKKRYETAEGIQERTQANTQGIFTVQYPEERIPLPEEFRVLPFLVYDEGENGAKNLRCTACGICAKVCPPQCIWIARATDPATGKPSPHPAEFSIDVDICMNCGFCAEYCPFDAIKMDHDFELAGYERGAAHLFNKEHLMKPASYYESIRPANAAREAAARAEKAKPRP